MKIRSIRIESFGKHSDRTWTDIPDGLTLVTGNNESGKTTMMEFMRSTMFPSQRRSYPMPAKTDSGSMVLETQSGETLNLIREQRKVYEATGKQLPEERFAVDSDTYRSIFAMDLHDLTNEDAISSESIRNRFLTIPGGEKVPSIVKELEKQKTQLMNNDRITEKNVIGMLTEDIRNIDQKISEMRRNEGEYDSICESMGKLSVETERLRAVQDESDRQRERHRMLMSQKGNIEHIRSLESEIKELSYAGELTDDDSKWYSSVCERIAYLEHELRSIDIPQRTPVERIDAMKGLLNDIMTFRKRKEEDTNKVEQLKDEIAESEEFLDDAGIDPALATPEMRMELIRRSKSSAPIIPMLLLLAACGAFAAGFLVSMYIYAAGTVLAAIGVILLIRRKGSLRAWMDSVGFPTVPGDRIPSFVIKLERVHEAYESLNGMNAEADDITARLNTRDAELKRMLAAMDIRGDGEGVLGERIRSAEDDNAIVQHAEATETELGKLTDDIDAAAGEYGGIEMFEKALTDSAELRVKEAESRTIRESVVTTAGIPPEEVWDEISVDREFADVRTEMSAIGMEIGELRQKARDIIDDRTLTELQARRNARAAELDRNVRKWIRLSLESYMVDSSCAEIYERMQPSVIRTANRYLALMTSSRYSLDPDPRLDEIVIKDEVMHKTSRQWSSGLGDQVYLSLKMAVAKEMGAERLPMILDDILVRFDRGRRKGACAALLDFAKDQQVFLFSCDSTVEHDLPETVNVIRL